MTFTEAEGYWQKELELFEDEGDGVVKTMISVSLLEATLKAFEARRMYKADCEKLREALESKPTHHDYVATVTNFVDDSGAEKAEATFDADNYKITITAERREK